MKFKIKKEDKIIISKPEIELQLKENEDGGIELMAIDEGQNKWHLMKFLDGKFSRAGSLDVKGIEVDHRRRIKESEEIY